MAHVLKPRVAETSTTTGTGAFALAAALSGHQRFSAVMSTSDTTDYMIVADDGTWEEGIGTYSSANTLTRTTVTNSSNAGSVVNFAAGSKTVLMTPSAKRLSLIDQLITNPVFAGSITEGVFTITDGTSVNIDPGNGTIQLWTLGASRTPTAPNFLAGESVTLMVADGTSAFSVDWTTNIGVVWVGGAAPTLPLTGYAVIALWKVGSAVYGAGLGNVA